MLSSILQNPLSLLASEGSPVARDPVGASLELARLERNRSLYQTLEIPEAVQATETRIQALFRPFNREEYFLRIASIGQGLRSADERRFAAALDQARNLPGEYAPMLLRGIALDLRKEAEELSRSRRRNNLSMRALEAVASVEIEALHQEGRPQSAERLSHEFQEILGRIAQSLHSGQSLMEAVNAERSAHPASPFVETYLERGVGSLVSALSRPNLNDWDFSNCLLDYAETLEHGQGLYTGARIIAESLVDSTGEIHQRASEILNRIPEEEEIDGRYRFILNLGLVTADSNRSVLQLGATAMSFAAAGGLASAAESGTATWLTSSGASEATALLGSSLAHTVTMGAIQPLLAPGAEHLTWNSYIQQFVHMSGLTGVLGIRGALMRDVASPIANYASIIGTMTAYDYATESAIRNLPFTLNLANVVGNDLLMRSGEILLAIEPRFSIPRLQAPQIESRSSGLAMGLAASLLSLSGCQRSTESTWETLATFLGASLGFLAMARQSEGSPASIDARITKVERALNSTNEVSLERGFLEVEKLLGASLTEQQAERLGRIHWQSLSSNSPSLVRRSLLAIPRFDALPENYFNLLLEKSRDTNFHVAHAALTALAINIGDDLPNDPRLFQAFQDFRRRFPDSKFDCKSKNNDSPLSLRDVLVIAHYLRAPATPNQMPLYSIDNKSTEIKDILALNMIWQEHELQYVQNIGLTDSPTYFQRAIKLVTELPHSRSFIDLFIARFSWLWRCIGVSGPAIGAELPNANPLIRVLHTNPIVDGIFSPEAQAGPEPWEQSHWRPQAKFLLKEIIANAQTPIENLSPLRALFQSRSNLSPENLRRLNSRVIEPIIVDEKNLSDIALLEARSRYQYIFGSSLPPTSRWHDHSRADFPSLLETTLNFARRVYSYGARVDSYTTIDPELRKPLLDPDSEAYPFLRELESLVDGISGHPGLEANLESTLALLRSEFANGRAHFQIDLPIQARGDKGPQTQWLIHGLLERFSANTELSQESRGILTNALSDFLPPPEVWARIQTNLFPEFAEFLVKHGNFRDAISAWLDVSFTRP